MSENISDVKQGNLQVFKVNINKVKILKDGLNKTGKENKDQDEDPEKDKRYC